jgi:hypothetical protein
MSSTFPSIFSSATAALHRAKQAMGADPTRVDVEAEPDTVRALLGSAAHHAVQAEHAAIAVGADAAALAGAGADMGAALAAATAGTAATSAMVVVAGVVASTSFATGALVAAVMPTAALAARAGQIALAEIDSASTPVTAVIDAEIHVSHAVELFDNLRGDGPRHPLLLPEPWRFMVSTAA